MVRVARLRRYGWTSRWYDVVSLEHPVYRLGRTTGLAALHLAPGDRVLDVGCGTGLNFTPLIEAVGAHGEVVGVDTSVTMLGVAARRIARAGWANVSTVTGDAAALPVALAHQTFDAAVCTYSLSVIADWEAAWGQVLSAVRPGGRILVVDLALPTGWARWWAPLARLACFAGGADPHRLPWRRLVTDTDDVHEADVRSGHIHVAVGTRRQETR